MADDNPQKVEPSPKVPIKAFSTVFFTLFLDLVGFGIIIPVLPFYASSFGASPLVVTLLSTGYSLAQFVMSPVLGSISDRYGRRPVMLVSIAGACASMLVLGFANALWMVFAARIINGICNSNVSTAQSYVADRVPPEDRARYMGLMGAAIGFGFVFGPAIGGMLSVEGHPELPFFVAAGLAAVNWLMAYRWLPESARTPGRVGSNRRPRFGRDMLDAVRGTPLLWLVGTNFLFYVAFAGMESTFALLMEARLDFGARETGYLFTFIGVTIVITQGALIGRVVAVLGEKRTLLLGMLILAAAFTTTGTARGLPTIVVGAAGIALGNGLISPSVTALVSRAATADNQGTSLGINASAASLARIVGPVLAGVFFQWVGPGVPLVFGAGIIVLAALTVMYRVPDAGGLDPASPASDVSA